MCVVVNRHFVRADSGSNWPSLFVLITVNGVGIIRCQRTVLRSVVVVVNKLVSP